MLCLSTVLKLRITYGALNELSTELGSAVFGILKRPCAVAIVLCSTRARKTPYIQQSSNQNIDGSGELVGMNKSVF